MSEPQKRIRTLGDLVPAPLPAPMPAPPRAPLPAASRAEEPALPRLRISCDVTAELLAEVTILAAKMRLKSGKHVKPNDVLKMAIEHFLASQKESP